LLLSSFFLSPRLPLSSVLPYTTLFRSFSFRVPRQGKGSLKPERKPPPCRPAPRRPLSNPPDEAAGVQLDIASSSSQGFRPSDGRSEEHTSELQSRENLVCRLLLEKKKS